MVSSKRGTHGRVDEYLAEYTGYPYFVGGSRVLRVNMVFGVYQFLGQTRRRGFVGFIGLGSKSYNPKHSTLNPNQDLNLGFGAKCQTCCPSPYSGLHAGLWGLTGI